MANTAVFGIYSTHEQVAAAAERMRTDGFRTADISVLCSDSAGTKDLALQRNSKTLPGAAKGGIIGIIVGGAIAWVLGAGILAIPALQPLLAAGPVLALLSGAGAGAIIGGAIGALAGSGTPQYQARRYQGRNRKGGILFSVHSDSPNWTRKAKTALEQTGAEGIGTLAEPRGDYGNTDRPSARLAG